MDEQNLHEALRNLSPPDAAAAEERAGQLVRAAHARRPARRRRRPRRTATLIACLIAGATTLTAVQGAAVARWASVTLRDWVAGRPSHKPAALGALPGDGRLLVSSGRDAWIVGQGLTRPIAQTSGDPVSWSAFGNFVACACGDRLEAIALDGRLAWTERFASPVLAPVWSPDGNRIAFVVGRELYVTEADGTRARGLRPIRGNPAAAVAAWRPGPSHELAVADRPGRLDLIDTDTDRDLASVPSRAGLVSLGWSSDGRRLLAATTGGLRVYDARGQLISRATTPPGEAVTAAQISPTGRQLAYVITQTDGLQLAALAPVANPDQGRGLLDGQALGDLQFAPDGRWLLVGWHRLDSWMFFTTGPGQIETRQITGVAARLGHGEPIVVGWCCQVARPPDPPGH
jgi:hypothetical protein